MPTNTLTVLCREGDVRHQWDPNNPEEVDYAKETFDNYRARGYLAYRMEGTHRGTQLHAFDPQAGAIILAPPMRGG